MTAAARHARRARHMAIAVTSAVALGATFVGVLVATPGAGEREAGARTPQRIDRAPLDAESLPRVTVPEEAVGGALYQRAQERLRIVRVPDGEADAFRLDTVQAAGGVDGVHALEKPFDNLPNRRGELTPAITAAGWVGGHRQVLAVRSSRGRVTILAWAFVDPAGAASAFRLLGLGRRDGLPRSWRTDHAVAGATASAYEAAWVRDDLLLRVSVRDRSLGAGAAYRLGDGLSDLLDARARQGRGREEDPRDGPFWSERLPDRRIVPAGLRTSPAPPTSTGGP
jgi:hypothetical protein